MTEPRLEPSGVVIIDKPKGPTSFAVVASVRRLYRTRKVGHAGTLDPMATGVLVVLLGEATKLSQHLTAEEKVYEAEVSFGFSTDSLDADGTRLPFAGPLNLETAIDETTLRSAIETERARTQQVPPAHSAIKVNGRRAYRLARGGETPDLAERQVRVSNIELLDWSTHGARFVLRVSKGYYVRAFARDLCRSLGVPGHLSSLRRTESGCFTLHDALAWPLPEPIPPITIARAVRRALPTCELTATGTERARHGKLLSAEHFVSPAPADSGAWFAPDGRLIALGVKAGTEWKVTRGFRTPEALSYSTENDPSGNP